MQEIQTGKVTFHSSLEDLTTGFEWAKKQALEYVHMGEDPVGMWYEAALPGREAFCMRDLSHQIYGAAVLGLEEHSKNMLMQFADHISESRDYCTYWEITREGLPCAEDYISDEDFWYNLPANFELIRACYHQYLWTGDRNYLEHPVFTAFYSKTCNEFIDLWDKDKDGILEHYSVYGRRGIASYNECDIDILMAGDMAASQYAAYGCYAKILKLTGRGREAEKYLAMQKDVKKSYLEKWYDKKNRRFYGAIQSNGKFYPGYYKEGNFLPIYFGILDGEECLEDALQQLKEHGADNVEGAAYLPQIYYDHGEEALGYQALCYLCNPELDRREYPEVSFAVLGSITNQVMGITVNEQREIVTCPKLPNDNSWAEILYVPAAGVHVDVKHDGNVKTTIMKHADDPEKNERRTLSWKAAFTGIFSYALINGQKYPLSYERDAANRTVSYVSIELTAEVPKTIQVV